jgi:Holliday junction resolvase RusA-like endonuclease
MYMTAGAKKLKETIRKELKKQPLKEDVSISLIYRLKGKIDTDLDNFQKLTLDALNGYVYEDDKQITELHCYKERGHTDWEIEILAV